MEEAHAPVSFSSRHMTPRYEKLATAHLGTVQELAMSTRATGTFDVNLAPLAPAHAGDDAPLSRMSIDKTFHGDLEGTSRGEMLSVMTAVKGSAGYVAMEKVTGALHGREGTFAFQHSATMSRGAPQLSVTVVPDSGTGALTGITGSLQIVIENKQHSYIFDYALDGAT
jgi:hypothetical protein